MSDTDEFLQTACEQFLGMEVDDIRSLLLDTFEGHLRAIGIFENYKLSIWFIKNLKIEMILQVFKKSVQWT